MLFMGVTLYLNNSHPLSAWLSKLLSILVLIISVISLFDILTGSLIHELFTLFQHQVSKDFVESKTNNMGANTAIMFIFIACSQILYLTQHLIASQAIAFTALAIPSISFTGYAYQIDDFYGKMSVLTTTIGFAITFSALIKTSHVGAVNAILSPHVGGKIARLQTFLGYAVPTLLGYFLVRTFNASEVHGFGIFVITICWFIILMASASAILQERVDSLRRASEEQLALTAMSDPLTGLGNRRKFVEFSNEEISRVKRIKNRLWLLLIDVDHFKKINDTAGHAVGDKVLIELSKTFRNAVRETDLVARVGGEEFAIVLASATQEGALRVAEDIRQRSCNLHVGAWTNNHPSITVSIGVTSNDGTIDIEETFKKADEALYKAKNSGRNQVQLLDSDTSESI
jgi:diguanylate cyclase (GGDEF)-like protein